jgi:hypothetical protein
MYALEGDTVFGLRRCAAAGATHKTHVQSVSLGTEVTQGQSGALV